MKHVHAELMAQYAQDAMETDTPWERWERVHCGEWVDCLYHPGWFSGGKYRRKPQTITRTITYPKPLSELPEGSRYFYIATPNLHEFYFVAKNGQRYLRRGLAHATKEAAIEHGKALAGAEE